MSIEDRSEIPIQQDSNPSRWRLLLCALGIHKLYIVPNSEFLSDGSLKSNGHYHYCARCVYRHKID